MRPLWGPSNFNGAAAYQLRATALPPSLPPEFSPSLSLSRQRRRPARRTNLIMEATKKCMHKICEIKYIFIFISPDKLSARDKIMRQRQVASHSPPQQACSCPRPSLFRAYVRVYLIRIVTQAFKCQLIHTRRAISLPLSFSLCDRSLLLLLPFGA